MNRLGRLWRRCSFLLSQVYWLAVACTGALLVAVGMATWANWQPWSGVLIGIGGSVLATVIVSMMGPAADKVYQSYLRLGVIDFYADRARFPPERWVQSLSQAKHHCILLGQAHGEWCKDDGFRGALSDRLNAGVQVEIFFLNPTGGAARVRHKEDRQGLDDLVHRTSTSIQAVWNIREELEDAVKNRLKLYVYDATPSLGLTWIDGTMFVTHYLAGFINRTAPLLCIE